MSKDKQPNPIYDRLTRNTHGPSTWLVIGLAVGIGGAALVTALTSLDDYGNLYGPILQLTLVIDLISPAVIAVYAANLASKDQRAENFQMMKLTGITEETMITGYASTAFHRLRLLAAVATALAPTLIMVSTLALLMLDHRRPSVDTELSGIISFLVVCFPVVILLTSGLWFFQKAAGVLGASLAVWWKRPIPVMIVSSFILLIFPPIALIATSWSISILFIAIYILLSAVFQF